MIILITALTSRRLGRISDVEGALDATQSAGDCGNGMSDSYRVKNLDPDVLMMEPAEDWGCGNGAKLVRA